MAPDSRLPSARQIAAATRKLWRRAGAAPAKAVPVDKAIVSALKTPALRGVTVHLAGGKLSLGHIPVEALRELARILTRVRLPSSP